MKQKTDTYIEKINRGKRLIQLINPCKTNQEKKHK